VSNGFSICNYSECEHSKDCKRYVDKGIEVEEYHFQAICFKNNGFDQLIKKEVEIVPVVEKVKDDADIGKDVKDEVKKEEADTNK